MMKWLFRRKKTKAIETVDAISSPEVEDIQPKPVPEKVDLNKYESRISYIRDLYEQIKEAKKECEEAKFEYGQVTSYLKDIQLIDAVDGEAQKILSEIATGIHELTLERSRIQKQKYKITDEQRRAMDAYEDIVATDLNKLKEYEAYFLKVKNDLRQLTSEKDMLVEEKQEIVIRQRSLKALAKSVAIINFSLAAMALTIMLCFKIDIKIPFIGIIAFCFLVLAFILFEARKNRINMVLTEKKCNRAILLSNRVKIKYVNTKNVINSLCNKYIVRNGVDMEYVYGQYLIAKAEWNRQQESTMVLAKYNQVLVHELQKIGVKDCDIWFHQAEALFDSREMVEVRHHLNVRRQMLRERLDYNADIMEKCLNELEELRQKSPEYKEDVETVLKDNQI